MTQQFKELFIEIVPSIEKIAWRIIAADVNDPDYIRAMNILNRMKELTDIIEEKERKSK